MESVNNHDWTINTINAYESTTEILKEAAKEFGWNVVSTICEKDQDNDKCIYWGNIQSIKHIDKGYYTNHGCNVVNNIPGFAVVEKKVDTTLALRTMSKLFLGHFDFYPQTWIFPHEMKEMPNVGNHAGISVPSYVYKPDHECRGNGIKFFNDPALLEEITKDTPAVVQKYIETPLLWNGYKFDIRSFFVIMSLKPLEIYYAKGSFCRLCAIRYDVDNFSDTSQHLSNFSVNNKEGKFDPARCKSLLEMKQMLKQNGHDADEVERKIVISSLKAIIAVIPDLMVWQNAMTGRENTKSFQIIGVDTMVTSDLEVKFIEMNEPRIRSYYPTLEGGRESRLFLQPVAEIAFNLHRDLLKILTEPNCKETSFLEKVFPASRDNQYIDDEDYKRFVCNDVLVVCKAAELFNKFNKKRSLTIDLDSFQSLMAYLSIDDLDDVTALYKTKLRKWKTYLHYVTKFADCNYHEELSFQGFMELLLELFSGRILRQKLS
uniref:tubulin polyglutamylase TTLL11-like n=1 Tax=Ciona intestinalis TaxID=7719 RepID=UPI0002B8EA1E|nr:tubulin polyglutamylase TTLL11-like [Ciona intestinalis]|eukprot:XP_004227566.1 tubulin polyglutamylase TTLL11-like [Ciona intestinalis]